MIEHLDRQGQPITYEQYMGLMYDPNYKHVAKDLIGGQFVVSTVWLGQDMGMSFLGCGDLELFETMIFQANDEGDLIASNPVEEFGRVRYATEEQALAGHREAVKWAASQP